MNLKKPDQRSSTELNHDKSKEMLWVFHDNPPLWKPRGTWGKIYGLRIYNVTVSLGTYSIYAFINYSLNLDCLLGRETRDLVISEETAIFVLLIWEM